jgi:hypothetical protein
MQQSSHFGQFLISAEFDSEPFCFFGHQNAMANSFRLPMVKEECTHISAYIAGQLNIFYKLPQKFVHFSNPTFEMLWHMESPITFFLLFLLIKLFFLKEKFGYAVSNSSISA